METKDSQKTFSALINGISRYLQTFSPNGAAPVKTMKPILQKPKEMIGDKAIILKINVDKSLHAASSYHVQSVPTLIVFKKERSFGGNQASSVQIRYIRFPSNIRINIPVNPDAAIL